METEAAYSPTRLELLFETNISAVQLDIERTRRYKQSIEQTSLINENTDVDDLSQYTLETDSGIKSVGHNVFN